MSARRFTDGQHFGGWTVLVAYPSPEHPQFKADHAWCRCTCGNERMVFRPHLTSKRAGGCRACWRKKVTAEGQVRNGWRITSSTSDARVFECVGCSARTTRFDRSAGHQLPLCIACHPESKPTSRANAKRTGISREGIRLRIKRGWSVEDAVRLPRQS